MASFWEMGGYAAFIWSSWGIAVLVIVIISARSVLRATAVAKQLAELERHQ